MKLTFLGFVFPWLWVCLFVALWAVVAESRLILLWLRGAIASPFFSAIGSRGCFFLFCVLNFIFFFFWSQEVKLQACEVGEQQEQSLGTEQRHAVLQCVGKRALLSSLVKPEEQPCQLFVKATDGKLLTD